MAILKDLIVNGAARFIGDAYFATIKSGVWNGSKITKDYLPTFALTQTATSTADAGTNTWSIKFDGTSIGSFSVKNGSKGSTGNTGARGATISTGTAVTGDNASGISATVADSKANDLYINTSNWNIYKASAANTWGKIGNIKGATGASTASTITWVDKNNTNIAGAIGFRGGNNEIYYDSGGLNYNAHLRILYGASSIWTDPKANTESNLGIKKTDTNAGSIFLYSQGSTTGSRGIYCQNQAGNYLSLISTDKDNNVYIGGKINIDNNGYLYTGWIRTNSGGFNNFDTESVSRIYCSNDQYIRYLTPTQFISKLNLLTTNTDQTISGTKTFSQAINGNISGNATTVGNYSVSNLLHKVTVVNNAVNDFNTFENMSLTGRGDPTTGASLSNAPWTGTGPAGGYGVLTYLWSNYGTQMAWGYNSNKIYIRNKHANQGAVWETSWDSLVLTSELSSARVNYATSSGSASTWSGKPTWIGNSKPTYNWSEITQSGANDIEEGMGTFTDNTEIFSSFASDYGFADSNATGKVYRRNALKMYKYIKGKLDSVYQPKGTYLTSHQSLSNYVTLDGTQTITGTKTFSSSVEVQDSASITGNLYTSGDIIFDGFAWGTLKNPNSVGGGIDEDVIWQLPAQSGTLALVSQIPNTSNFVTLTSDQTIGGTKTFSSSIHAPAYYQTSDINYKNIKDYISLNNSDIANLPIFNFTWKNIKDSDMLSGTSAQDIQKLLPNVVKGNDKLTVDYGALGTILSINAAREIEQLKNRIKELEDKLNGR